MTRTPLRTAETKLEREAAATRSWFKRSIDKVIAGAQPTAGEPRRDRASALVCVPGEPVRIIKREDR